VDHQIVARLAEPVLPEHQVAIAEAHDRYGAVAAAFVLAQLRIDGSDAQSASYQHNRAIQLADVARQPKWTDKIQYGVAFAERHHFQRGLAHRLDHDRHGAPAHVEICHSQRNSFPMLVDTSHDEMPGTRRPRHVRRVHVPKKGNGTKLLPMSDEEHNTPWKTYDNRKSVL